MAIRTHISIITLGVSDTTFHPVPEAPGKVYPSSPFRPVSTLGG